MNSSANLSSIVRLAGCFGLKTLHVAGTTRVDENVARDAAEHVELRRHRTLPSFLEQLKRDGVRLVGLEQAMGSISLPRYTFAARTALVIGNERRGLR
jgi:tRNA G18 (ribose-2'-O)-methylase SpoU